MGRVPEYEIYLSRHQISGTSYILLQNETDAWANICKMHIITTIVYPATSYSILKHIIITTNRSIDNPNTFCLNLTKELFSSISASIALAYTSPICQQVTALNMSVMTRFRSIGESLYKISTNKLITVRSAAKKIAIFFLFERLILTDQSTVARKLTRV